MANNCLIGLQLTFKTDDDAEKYIKVWDARVAERKEKNVDGLYMGGDRYLFDPIMAIYGNHLYIYGWVKWCLNDDDIIEWLDDIKAIAPIDYMRCDLEEPGFQIYGYYELIGNTLTYTFVPEDRWPDYESDTFHEDLETILQTTYETYTVVEDYNV